MTQTTEHLAQRFTERLRAELTDQQWAEMRQKNASGTYALCCASHDYLDANMLMERAFIQVHGRAPNFSGPGDEDINLWNQAWDLARQTALTSKPTMTPRMIALARHALGLPNQRGQTFRNRFIVMKDHANWFHWRLMQDAGLAGCHENSITTPGADIFFLTRAGAEAAKEADETLCPEDFPPSA